MLRRAIASFLVWIVVREVQLPKVHLFCALLALVLGAGLRAANPAYQQLIAFQGDSQLGNSPAATPVLASDGYLYGETTAGGANRAGVVYKVKPDGTAHSVIYSFSIAHGGNGSLLSASDGFLYGVATDSVFKLAPDGSTFVVLRTFNPANGDGTNSRNALAEGPDGFLYGTTAGGGANGAGTVFKLDKTGANFAVIHSFSLANADGQGPSAGVTIGKNGVLYGAAYSGGAYGYGTLYSLNSDGSNYQTLYSFNGASPGGGYPVATPIIGSDGMLYGTTYQNGGPFRVSVTGSNFQNLRNFDYTTEGSFFSAGLTQGTDGALYGQSFAAAHQDVGGTIFKIQRDGTGYQALDVLPMLTTATTGIISAGVAEIDAADILAVDSTGGVGGVGTLIRIPTEGGSNTAVYDFGVEFTGIDPIALAAVSGGRLYGITSSGTVFGVNPDGSDFTSLAFFNGSAAVGLPAALTAGSAGYLYGVTKSGGTAHLGTVFRMKTDGSQFAIIHSLSASEASSPVGIVQGSDGTLYVTASTGGSAGRGAIEKMNADGSGVVLLHTFTYLATDGAMPLATPILGSDGALYGTTTLGGNAGGGVIYRLSADGSQFAILHNFASQSGESTAPLKIIEGSDGALYGLTNSPVLFRLQKDGSQYSTLAVPPTIPSTSLLAVDGDFYTSSGLRNLIQDSSGNFFFTGAVSNFTSPQFQSGGLFRINADGTGFELVATFDSNPLEGALLLESDGTLYGATSGIIGPYPDTAVLFRFDGTATALTVAPPAPSIVAQPASQVINCGGAATLSVAADGSGLSYQWQLNGVNIAGATTASYSLAAVSTLQAGSYTVVVTANNGTSTTSAATTVSVTSDARPLNLSTRAVAGSGANALVAGFIISGTTSETVLIRGAGPALAAFQVAGSLTNPQLTLFDSSGNPLATNTGWGGDRTLALAFARVYAFPFAAGSADCALLATLPPGAYSAQVSGANGTSGIALIEVYDVPAN